MKIGNDTFEQHCDLIDVTSMHRPDTSWIHIDAHGHTHQWHQMDSGGGDLGPASTYSAARHYFTPTLIWVKDGESWYEDSDEPHDVGHIECKECGEHVTPGYTADSCTQKIPGIRSFRINGESVTVEEFKVRYAAACGIDVKVLG